MHQPIDIALLFSITAQSVDNGMLDDATRMTHPRLEISFWKTYIISAPPPSSTSLPPAFVSVAFANWLVTAGHMFTKLGWLG